MFGFSVPVVVGPMNGGMDYPPHYDLAGRMERFIVRTLRASAAFWNRIVPGKRQAALLLVANSRTWSALPTSLRKKKIIEFVENGVDMDLFEPATATAKDKKFRIIYVGRLVDWKRVDLLLDACAQLFGRVAFEVDLVGDGPLREALEEQVRRLSLTNHVRFHGRLPQSGVAERMSAADVMILPSMYECGGAVVLEAMASGLPVVAAKWGGPADYVADDTGVLIPPATPEIFVGELARVMLAMAKDAGARAEMGRAGRRRVAAIYDWRIKAKALLEIYKDVLSSQPAQMKVQTE
jgi:glycosyltransferase involved in cell wall biosynthesis